MLISKYGGVFVDNIKIIEKLKNKFNISYEEAKIALEKSNWNILDAVVYLESIGKVARPAVSTYFSNEYNGSYEEAKSNNSDFKESKEYKKESLYQSFFEEACKIIDKCNNIFFKIKRHNAVIINLPLTVMIVLIFFAFWIIIPSAMIALFFDMEFSIEGKDIENSKVNYVFKVLSDSVNKIKEEFKKGKK